MCAYVSILTRKVSERWRWDIESFIYTMAGSRDWRCPGSLSIRTAVSISHIGLYGAITPATMAAAGFTTHEFEIANEPVRSSAEFVAPRWTGFCDLPGTGWRLGKMPQVVFQGAFDCVRRPVRRILSGSHDAKKTPASSSVSRDLCFDRRVRRQALRPLSDFADPIRFRASGPVSRVTPGATPAARCHRHV